MGSHLLWHLLQKEQAVRAVCREGSPTKQVRDVFSFYDDVLSKNDAGALFTRIQKGMKYYTLGSTGFVDVRDVSR